MPWTREGKVQIFFPSAKEVRRHYVGAGVETTVYATRTGKKVLGKIIKRGSSFYWQTYSKTYGVVQTAIKKDGSLYR